MRLTTLHTYYHPPSMYYHNDQGAYDKGKRHGKGVYIAPELDGPEGVRSFYEGDWLENERHGQGKAVLNNGDVYIGQFQVLLPSWNRHRLHELTTLYVPIGSTTTVTPPPLISLKCYA